MISLPGTLFITQIQGKYGAFNKAKLTTDIGTFIVKDKRIEQYEEGKYDGIFVISEIKPYTYIYQSRAVLEILARLEDMTLNDTSILTDDDIKLVTAPDQHDPAIDEEKLLSANRTEVGSSVQKTISASIQQNATETVLDNDQSNVSSDEVLFGILWPLGEEIKLDSTEDRLKIREQTNRLKELGYQFDYKMQIWGKPSASPQIKNSTTTLLEQF